MAILALLLGSGKGTKIERNVNGKTLSMILDATVAEDFTAEAEPTEHPVEDGADIADHVILKPKKLTIRGVVSETPFSVGNQIAGAAASIAGKIGEGVAGALGGTVATIGGGKIAKSLVGMVADTDRDLQDVVNELLAIRDAKLPVTIQTGLTQYKDYILTGMQVTRDKSVGRAINVSLNFKELLIAKSEVINIPKIKAALPTKNSGRKVAKEATGEKGKKGRSILKNLFGG